MTSTVDEVTAGIAGVAEATDRLRNGVESLDDRSVRAASPLPGWTRAHVLTHLARHADALRRVAVAARRGELVEPYPGGAAGRAEQIAAGADRSADSLIADLRGAADRLAHIWSGLPAELWPAPTKALHGTRPLAAGVVSRWVEVEVHHVDLTVGYSAADWPAAFVATALPTVLAGLPGPAGPAGQAGEHAGWLLRCPDAGGAWHIDRSADRAVVRPAIEEPDAAYAVEGDRRSMLAWLLGRPACEPLKVTRGARPAALALPTLFPFP